MGIGQGYGKVILFGEHFVVYGLPAIVSALGRKTVATVERIAGSEYELVDNRPATPGYKELKAGEQDVSVNNIFSAMGITPKKTPIRITLSGDLVAASGVGASAASCAAIARALNDEFGMGYSHDKINEVAFEGEKGFHGTPSGIDNTAAVFGGVLVFKRDMGGGRPLFERVNLKETFEVVVADTGVTASTAKVVGDVRGMKETDPAHFETLLGEYEQIVGEAQKALSEGDLIRVGTLMNRNMDLLREIRVSSNELELLIKIASRNGAFGAKLTGTGRGGLMYALTPGRVLQKGVAEAIEREGFTTFTTTIGDLN